MRAQKLQLSDYYDWAHKQWLCYAAGDTFGEQRKYLEVNLASNYRVRIGKDELAYEGGSIIEAIEEYNQW